MYSVFPTKSGRVKESVLVVHKCDTKFGLVWSLCQDYPELSKGFPVTKRL